MQFHYTEGSKVGRHFILFDQSKKWGSCPPAPRELNSCTWPLSRELVDVELTASGWAVNADVCTVDSATLNLPLPAVCCLFNVIRCDECIDDRPSLCRRPAYKCMLLISVIFLDPVASSVCASNVDWRFTATASSQLTVHDYATCFYRASLW